MTDSTRVMNRNFLLLWQGQIVSQFGTQLFQVIVILCLKQATESATAVGLFMMAYTLPTVLLGPLGGVLVDRCSRRSVLVAGDVLRGLILISLALVLWFAPHSFHVLVSSLFLYSVVEGAIGAVWQPTGLSVVPDLVPKESLSGANSIMQGSFQVCTVLAQAFAGILFRVLGTPVLMLIDGLTYVYAAVSDLFVRIPALPTKPAVSSGTLASFKNDALEGLRRIHARPGMRTIFYTMALFQLLMVPMVILFPFYVDQQLRAGSQWYGFLLATSGLGTLVGYGIGGTAKLIGNASSRMILASTVAMSLCLASLAIVHSPWVALWIVGSIGITSGFNSLKLLTILQLATPTAIRGRVFGMLLTITQGLAPLAMGLTGLVADLTRQNIPLIYFGCGSAAAVLSVNIVLRRDCREFLAGDETNVPMALVVQAD